MQFQSSGLSVRSSHPSDADSLKSWLSDPNILSWFPMMNEREVEDSVKIWMSYAKLGYGLTALMDGKPCGMLNLYIQPFTKIAHTCLFSIIVAQSLRGKGIGTFLIERGQTLAKETFAIEILHLEVYDGNPAQRLYEKMGFTVYGKQDFFIKEDGKYLSKIFMQKML
ncbi:MAG: GNAT family N-acetyltransferase [Chlamydiae bacterium]|nr:GNAT family N-acetyltransferase [Chlamydiota bacterium]